MSAKNQILANQVEDEACADALRRHTEERASIRESLTATFGTDQRIRAAWLWGSFMRGDQDDLSDLDIWMLVPDEAVGEMAGAVRDACVRAGVVLSARENSYNAPANGGYIGALLAGTHGMHHLDIYWQGISSGRTPDGPTFIDRLSENFEHTAQSAPPKPPEPDLEPYANRIVFVWLMLSVAAKYLARDPDSDMSLMFYSKNAFEETATHFGLVAELGEVDWSVPTDPVGKVNLMRHIAEKAAVLEAAIAKAGMPMPADANGCLMSYFDLVEAILRG